MRSWVTTATTTPMSTMYAQLFLSVARSLHWHSFEYYLDTLLGSTIYHSLDFCIFVVFGFRASQCVVCVCVCASLFMCDDAKNGFCIYFHSLRFSSRFWFFRLDFPKAARIQIDNTRAWMHACPSSMTRSQNRIKKMLFCYVLWVYSWIRAWVGAWWLRFAHPTP